MSVRPFGERDGQQVFEVTLRSQAGAIARIITFGAVIRDLEVPLKGGGTQHVVLGYNDLDNYVKHSPHFGAVPGRVANRIANARFTLDGKTHELTKKPDDTFSIHGGLKGFGKSVWQLAGHDETSATLTIFSSDGDNGYPGNLTATCRYTLLEPATLRIDFTATTDAATPVNLCQHAYFNLDGSADVLGHTLHLDAPFYAPQDADGISTGEVLRVVGTPYDFIRERPLKEWAVDGSAFHYDNNFILSRTRLEPSGVRDKPLAYVGTLRSPKFGLALDTWTTQPAVQLYDGWKVNTPVPGLHGKPYGANAGVCLETQHYPDSPNHPHFPSTILRPGDVYREVTEYRFS